MRERGQLDRGCHASPRQPAPVEPVAPPPAAAHSSHRVSRLSSTQESLCYCSCVRIVTRLFVVCAAVALLAACLNSDPLNSALSGDDSSGDVQSSLDISIVLPAAPLELLVVPSISGSVFFDHRPPPSRLTTAEVFRPPRVRA
jgi:hypothetical protein